MREVFLETGKTYHIYSQGNNEQPIFRDEADMMRFLLLILFLQFSEMSSYDVGRIFQKSQKGKAALLDMFSRLEEKTVGKERLVKLLNFVLMPNHFHLTVRQLKDDGISEYLQKVLNSHARYFNLKHGQVGHLFRGRFKNKHVDKENYLNFLSAYIHLNPRELDKWKGREEEYFWSSYSDYTRENRWPGFLDPTPILDGFGNGSNYKGFVENSGAKLQELSNLFEFK